MLSCDGICLLSPHSCKWLIFVFYSLQVVANYFGKDKKYIAVKDKKIHWAGNRKSAPPDTPKCGFDGAKCPPESRNGTYYVHVHALAYYRPPEGGRLNDMKVVSGFAFLRTYYV